MVKACMILLSVNIGCTFTLIKRKLLKSGEKGKGNNHLKLALVSRQT